MTRAEWIEKTGKYYTAKDLLGKRFGRLLVLSDSKTRNDHREVIWECLCDCGKRVTRTTSTLIAKKSYSCGCSKKRSPEQIKKQSLRQIKPDTTLNMMLCSYRTMAPKRGIEFSLSKESFFALVVRDCFYCGAEPSMLKKSRYASCLVNGVDRLDNKKGYIEGNCVPCCTTCNYMKRALSFDQFLAHIKKISKHRPEDMALAFVVESLREKNQCQVLQ